MKCWLCNGTGKIGHLKLSELKPHNINAFFVAMTQNGARKDGKAGGYSKGTIAKTRNVISSVLRTAAEWEIIGRNPCDKVRLQGEDTAEKLKFFTPEQTSTFLDYIEQHYTVKIPGHKRVDNTGIPYTVGDYETTKEVPEQLRVLFNLAVYTGLRKGELLALQWSDIDLTEDVVRVSKAITLVGGKPVVKPPKSRTSNRTVSIPHSLSQRLRKLYTEQLKHRLYVGDYWKGENWVFTQDNGKLMNYSTPYQAMQDIIRRYNTGKEPEKQLPLIPFHGLRHTSATLLIASKQDLKTVSSRLGHAQTSTTMNIYAHALQESDRKAATALENLLTKQA